MKTDDVNRMIDMTTKNIMAGADIHAGDGGYSIGTQEAHDAFVKVRNQSLAKARIKELAEQAGSTHKQSLGVYQFYTDELEKFAELIVKETLQVARAGIEFGDGMEDAVYKYFGVEE